MDILKVTLMNFPVFVQKVIFFSVVLKLFDEVLCKIYERVWFDYNTS